MWKKIFNDLKKDIWGKAYQIVVKKLGKVIPEAPRSSAIMNNVVAELFPKHSLREKWHFTINSEATPVTTKELQDSAKSFIPGKAPGPDGILRSVIKIIAQEFSDLLLNAYNACLLTSAFATIWKR